MLFVYNHGTDCYEGERLAVPAALMDDAVAELVKGGELEHIARLLLLDEAEWSDDIEGVELVSLCLHCRRPLGEGRERFCDVVCEAGFYVETGR